MNDFYKKLNKMTKLYPQLRRGQLVFNAMYSLYPNIAERYCGTEYDPFYNDCNINVFICKCYKDTN